MCLDPLVFCMLMIYWDSVPNHNRQIIASNASVHIHSHPLLVGCYTPAGHRIYSVAARSANTFEGYVKLPPPLQRCDESLHPDYLKGCREAA